MKILIVEDDAVSALVLRRTLEKLGHEVRVASNGTEAWEWVQTGDSRLIISDWMMPEMDGLELCRRIRARASKTYTYVILLTAKDRKEDRFEGLRAGADDFLVKPLDSKELIARLDVAQRILSMQEELHNRSTQLEILHSELAQQNAHLADAMTYLEVANYRFSELFMGLPIPCFTYDTEGRIHEWNRACEALYGIPSVQVFERYVWDIPSFTEDPEVIQDRLMRVFQGERIEALETEDRGADGSLRNILCNAFPLRGPDGTVVGAINANMDITERKMLERQVAEQLRIAKDLNVKLEKQRQELASVNARLNELVITDGLTGLKNHRHFRETLEKSFSFSSRHKLPFSVIMLDVDKFKSYNDTYGHPAGDEILRIVANVLLQNVRRHDLVARYGGEEFAVLLQATGAFGGMEVAERLRAAVEEYEWPMRPVTASFGVSTYYPSTESASELVDQADKGLYYSKAQGRNRVTHFRDLMEAAEKEKGKDKKAAA